MGNNSAPQFRKVVDQNPEKISPSILSYNKYPIATAIYCKELINKLFVYGFTRKQIAESAKLSTSTINKLLNRTSIQPHRTTLKKLLGLYYAMYYRGKL